MPAPVFIVTGVNRGIGRAIAEELQARGAAVVGAARKVADVPATAGLLPVCGAGLGCFPVGQKLFATEGRGSS
jgi:NAD(P)-dependent dehydrogenase (short-subunit alcohol dehydrogenase family)